MLKEQADRLIEEVAELEVTIRKTLTTSVPGSRLDTRHDVNLADGLVLVAQALERIGGVLERLASVVEQATRE